MNKSTHKLTICETLRQIRDTCQSDDKKDKKVRKLLEKAIEMAKKMNVRLRFYAGHYHNSIPWDKGMWKKNRKKYELEKLRNDPEYK